MFVNPLAFVNAQELTPDNDTFVYHLPKASFSVRRHGELHWAYTLDSYRKLRLLDANYERLLKIEPLLQAKVEALLKTIHLQEKQIDNFNIITQKCMDRLNEKHIEMMELVKPPPENWWDNNWKVVVFYIPLSIFVGFGVGYIVKDAM